MKRLAVLVLALSLGACAAIAQITSAKVNPAGVIVAANIFNGLEATATNYIRLHRCTPENRPVCREPEVADIIIPTVYSGRIARNNLVAFYEKYPNVPLGPQGLYDALIQASATLQQIYAQHGIGRK